jgi:hypothetical protein
VVLAERTVAVNETECAIALRNAEVGSGEAGDPRPPRVDREWRDLAGRLEPLGR